jgi:hypothetical protein
MLLEYEIPSTTSRFFSVVVVASKLATATASASDFDVTGAGFDFAG